MITTRLALAASVAVLAPFAQAAAQSFQIGSGNVAVIDKLEGLPKGSTGCSTILYNGATFGANNVNFVFHPQPNCPGPWGKVVLSVDISLNAGIQYDRTGTIWVAGVPLWFGTTAEPSPNLAPSWHFQKDVTDYSALFYKKQTGFVQIANYTNSTDTSIITSSARLTFYPPTAALPAPTVPDVVLPISAAGGGTVGLTAPTDAASLTTTLPTNIASAYADVYLQGQSGDEFWYTCVPDAYASTVQECGGGNFREGEFSIDGTPAGVAPVYPWIFTGGVDPYLWAPIPSVQTLDFKPFRVQLSPFAGLLSNGQPHTLSLGINGSNGYFSAAGALFLYLDPGSTQVTGSVTTNTLTGALPATTVSTLKTASSGEITGNLNTSLAHNFQISGTANLSSGPVTYTVNQLNNFANNQFFKINGSYYQQLINQTTTTSVTNTAATANGTSTSVTNLTYPLRFDYVQQQQSNGDYAITSRVTNQYIAGNTAASPTAETTATEKNSIQSKDTLLFDSNFNYLAHRNAASSAELVTYGSDKKCFKRDLASMANLLTVATTGQGGC